MKKRIFRYTWAGLLLSSSLLFADDDFSYTKPILDKGTGEEIVKENINKRPVVPSGVISQPSVAATSAAADGAKASAETSREEALQAENSKTIEELLARMASADQYLNYNGSFVYSSGGKVVQIDIVHRYSNGQESERLFTRSSAVKEIRRDAEHIYRIFPDKKVVLVEPRLSSAPQTQTRRLAQGVSAAAEAYDYALEGYDEVAGHRCTRINIYPKDHFRYGYRLCIDDDSGLLLKFQTVDNAGQAVEQMMFTEFSIADDPSPVIIPLDEFEVKNYRIIKPREPLQTYPASGEHWTFRDLPPGFSLKTRSLRVLTGENVPVEHLVMDDGLAAVSVFVRPAEKAEAGQAPSAQGEVLTHSGALHTLSRTLPAAEGGARVTILGEVPEETVLLVAESLQKRRASAPPVTAVTTGQMTDVTAKELQK